MVMTRQSAHYYAMTHLTFRLLPAPSLVSVHLHKAIGYRSVHCAGIDDPIYARNLLLRYVHYSDRRQQNDQSWFNLYSVTDLIKCRHWMRLLRLKSGSARRSRAWMRNAKNSLVSSVSWRRPSVCLRGTVKASELQGWAQ